MPKYIIHKDGVYNMYTTIADGACYDGGLTLDELTQIIKEQLGTDGLRDLPARLERAHAKGCSAMEPEMDLASCLLCNRSGPGETSLSLDEFVAQYLTLPPSSAGESCG